MAFTAQARICKTSLVLREISYTEFRSNWSTSMERTSTHSFMPLCKIRLPLRKGTQNSHFFDNLCHTKSYTEFNENPRDDVVARRLTAGRMRSPHNTCLLRKERSKRGSAFTRHQRNADLNIIYNHQHHHKHQGLDPLIRSVSKVTTALSNVCSVFQLFSFLVVCCSTISKGFGFVTFFASVETSSVSIHLFCLVCL